MNVTMNVDVDVRQYAPAAEGNSLDEDVNRVQAQYEASKVNVITCLPNGEERCVSFLKEEELVSAMARELGVRRTQICVSFTDNVVGMGQDSVLELLASSLLLANERITPPGADGRRLRHREQFPIDCHFHRR